MGQHFQLLAFGFTSPLWLWGLGSVAVPIAIHLWRRQTPRVLEWGPMKYLRQVMNRHARKVRLESLLILLVRCLLLAFLAMAVARPFAESNSSRNESLARSHKILVLDGSLSMSIRSGDQSRMDRARELAREIVQAASPGDTFHLCRIGNALSSVMIRRPAHDQSDVLREIDRLSQLDDAGDLAASLRQVYELLSEVPENQPVELYVISDFQTSQWALETPAEEAQLRQLVQELSNRGRLLLVDSGVGPVTNLSLRSLQVPEQVALRGRPFHVEVSIVNHSSEEQIRTVEVLADRVVRFSQSVTVAPGAEQKVTATLHLPEMGSEVLLEARIPPDALATDNQIQRVVAGRESLAVLLVDGRPSDKLSESASGFVRLAIAPDGSPGTKSSSPFLPTVIAASELSGTDLTQFDTIVLCDVPALTVGDQTRLTEYVQRGGGVIWGAGAALDPSTSSQSWELLFPMVIHELVDRSDDPVTFDTANLDHAVLSLFRGRADSGLATSPISRYARLQPRANQGWHIVLPFTTGDPAILERTVGQGRAVVVATSLDDSWGNWVLWPSYVPLLNRLLQYSLSGRIESEPLVVGSPLRQEVTRGQEGIWTLPGEKTASAMVEERESASGPGAAMLFWSETGTAGFYQLSIEAPQSLRKTFAVNASPVESDPRTVSPDSLRRGILSGVPFEWGLENAVTPAISSTLTASHQTSFSRPLVWMALGLLFVEILLSWRFRWGVAALTAVLLWGVWGLIQVG